MKRILVVSVVAILLVVFGAIAQDMKSQMIAVAPASLKWGPPPPVFEQNAKFVVLSGDPGKPGLYVVRLSMPAGYKVMPHWHPTDENVTVISGSFAAGMGEKWDQAALKTVPAGGYVLLPADMRHFATAMSPTIIQVHGMGPFQLTYVNPADDPSKRAPAQK